LIINYDNLGENVDINKLNYLFDKFYQTKDILKDKPKGLGLGLALCKLILSHYDGKIDIDEKFKNGLRFKIEIPLDKIGGT